MCRWSGATNSEKKRY
ncbi:hypothetical protein Q5N34_16190 [Vibrio cholerae]|nr:hypothetical protein [Vibrio cholerae]